MDRTECKPSDPLRTTVDEEIPHPKSAIHTSYVMSPAAMPFQSQQCSKPKDDSSDAALRVPPTPQNTPLSGSPLVSQMDATDASPIAGHPAVPPVRPTVESSRVLDSLQEDIARVTASLRTCLGEDEERYNMRHRRRGVALIFNHKRFETRHLREREGASRDGDALKNVLAMLSFEVRYREDLPFPELKKALIDVSMEDHKDADCLFVAVMTHGDTGGLLHAKDRPFTVEDVWSPFTADKVPSLAGKPKIFLFQACRGHKVEDRVWMADATDSPGDRCYSIPTCADFLFAHSSMEGYYSWRNPDEGSWFVQDFCKEIRENVRRRDILSLMTFTLRRVAVNRTSRANRQDMNLKKQMPVISSTLTKLLYFDATTV